MTTALELADGLRAALADELRERGIPGATLDCFVDGRLHASIAVGVADIARRTPLAPASAFPIYSITKTFTAVSALRLAEQGALCLDDPVDRWLPDLPWAARVSLRQLLANRAGVFDYARLPDYHAAVLERPARPWSFDEFVARAARRPLDFAPGSAWSYSNTGYTLARRILEKTTSLPFAELMRATVAGPLGLARTGVLASAADLQRVTPGHSTFFSDGVPPPRDVRSLYHPGWCGTGLLASTGPELCRFFEAVFDGSLLAADSLAQMTRLERVPGVHPPAVEPSYGLGLMGDPSGPLGKEYGHGGGGPGWSLYAGHWPDLEGRRVSMAVLCNHDGEHARPIAAVLAPRLAQGLRGGSAAPG